MKAGAYRNRIKKAMSSLGTYKPEFDKTITVLSEIYADMDEARQQFMDDGGEMIVEHTNKAGATNQAKNPYYQLIENLADRALRYASELGLTPAGLKKLKRNVIEDGSVKMSALDRALAAFADDEEDE